jgi:hypothetical protein
VVSILILGAFFFYYYKINLIMEKIKWDEMGAEPVTGFEQRAQDLRDQAKNSPGFLFPEDFEGDNEHDQQED